MSAILKQILIIMVLSMALQVLAQGKTSSDVVEDPIQRATFASDARLHAADTEGRRTFGGNVYTLTGLGLNFNRSLGQSRSFWSQLNHNAEDKIWTEVSPQGQIPNVDIVEKNKFQLVAGIDQILHPGKSRYWGFLVGLGLGLARSEYTATKYRRLCTFICGYDPNNPLKESVTDQYAFLSMRLGLSFRQTVIAGLVGDITFGLYPELWRTGERPQFTTYEGAAIETKKFESWVLEYSIEI